MKMLELKTDDFGATRYEEAVLERLMDESRHWQLKAYVTMCTTPVNVYTQHKPQFAHGFGPKLCIRIPRSRYRGALAT